MSDIAVELDHVWKKFRKGESYDSLRDLIPAMTRAVFSRNHRGELEAKEFWALRDVSFQVRRGEALGVIGPNGAGKSTILKMLSGIMKPNKGNIKVDGRLSALIEVGAGFHPDLTGSENIYLNGAILGMKKPEIDKKFDQIVAFSGLEDFIDTPVKRYSSGMHARLGFAVAAHVDPDILLVDEVLSVGDFEFQEKCIRKMLSFANSGTTVVFISHDLAAVNTLCPKAALLTNGTLSSIGPSAQVIREYIALVHQHHQGPQTEASIWDVSLSDENGEAVSSLAPGQKVVLGFKAKSNVPLGECLLGFEIYRSPDSLSICEYGLPLNSTRTNRDNNGCVDCLLGFEANLLRGAYTVILSIFHPPTGRDLVRVPNVAFFSVEERSTFQGIAHLNPRLRQR